MAVKSSKKGEQPLPQKSSLISRWSIALFLFAFLLNADTLRYQFAYDDLLVVAQNKFVDQGWRGLPKIFTTANLEGYNGQKESNYRPFSIAQFAVERSIFGVNPKGHHFLHILYYALACLLVFRLLTLIYKNSPLWLPVGITALYIAHPLHTEVVANLKSRDEITALIGIVATLVYLFKKTPLTVKDLFLVFFFAGIAFFSKESALPLVLIAPLTIFYFNPDGFKAHRNSLIAIGLAALLYIVLRQFIAEVPGPDFHLEDNALFAFEYPERLMAAMALIAHYAWIFIFPFRLRADYSFDQLQLAGWSDPWSYAGLVILALTFYLIIKWFRLKSITGYAATFTALFYIVTSNILIMTGATLAERFMFVPSLGLLILVGAFIFDLFKKQKISAPHAKLVLMVLAAGYSILTLLRNPVWYDNLKLFTITAKDSPRSIRALTNLASLRYEEAVRTNNPTTKAALLTESLFHLDAAAAIYDQYAHTHLIYGMINREQKKYIQAIESIRKAITIDPGEGLFDFQLALTYVQSNEDDLALSSFQKASDKTGLNQPGLYEEWAKLYFKRKQYHEAIEVYKKMIGIPTHKRFALNQITKIYRDQLLDFQNAQLYNDEIKKLVHSEK